MHDTCKLTHYSKLKPTAKKLKQKIDGSTFKLRARLSALALSRANWYGTLTIDSTQLPRERWVLMITLHPWSLQADMKSMYKDCTKRTLTEVNLQSIWNTYKAKSSRLNELLRSSCWRSCHIEAPRLPHRHRLWHLLLQCGSNRSHGVCRPSP